MTLFQTPHRKKLLLRSFLLLVFSLACLAAPRGVTPPPLPRPSETVTAIPTVQSGIVTPLPDFDEILIFAGGGGGAFPCPDFHTSEPGDIQIELPERDDRVFLCISLAGVRTPAPVKVAIEHAGGSGIVLESSELILDRGKHSVHWSGFEEEGGILAWTQEDTVRFALSIWWPATLPEGDWTVTAVQEGGPRAAGEFHYSRLEESSYIHALDEHSEQELLPHEVSFWSHYLPLTDRGDLRVSGGGYPPDEPVYILLYDKRDYQYFLIHAAVLMSDSQGSVDGEIEIPLEAGNEYLLYGITDPDIDLTDVSGSCTQMAGHACDPFIVSSPVAAGAPYATQVPLSCPGAPTQYIIPAEPAYVCTQAEAVNLRDGPARSGETLGQLDPGTIVHVVSGPECADNWSWWLVTLDDGTSGWVAEGGDEIDPYFICPLP